MTYRHEVIAQAAKDLMVPRTEHDLKILLGELMLEWEKAEQDVTCEGCGEFVEKGEDALDDNAQVWHAECLNTELRDPRDDSGYWQEES